MCVVVGLVNAVNKTLDLESRGKSESQKKEKEKRRESERLRGTDTQRGKRQDKVKEGWAKMNSKINCFLRVKIKLRRTRSRLTIIETSSSNS